MSIDETPSTAALSAAAELAPRLADALGDGLAAVAVHGSAVTGDLLPDLSDLDLRLFVRRAPDVTDVAALRAACRGTRLGPAATLQLATSSASGQAPSLVPGAYTWVHGCAPEGRIDLTAAELRRAGEEWLALLPGLLASGGLDWAATGPEGDRRMLRLLVTRLKPSVRGWLVRAGEDPLLVWSSGWPALLALAHARSASLAAELGGVLEHLTASPDHAADAGGPVLAVLARLVAVTSR